jgi:hypothetical protein
VVNLNSKTHVLYSGIDIDIDIDIDKLPISEYGFLTPLLVYSKLKYTEECESDWSLPLAGNAYGWGGSRLN